MSFQWESSAPPHNDAGGLSRVSFREGRLLEPPHELSKTVANIPSSGSDWSRLGVYRGLVTLRTSRVQLSRGHCTKGDVPLRRHVLSQVTMSTTTPFM